MMFRYRLPRRFDTLRIKLFVAIAGANALLAVIAFVVFSWSFDQGFVEYLNRADEMRLQPLITRLGDEYRTANGWGWLTQDRRRWPELVREVMGIGRGARRFEDGPPEQRSPRNPSDDPVPPAQPGTPPVQAGSPPQPAPEPQPPPEQLLTIDPRLMLFDGDQRMLVGRNEMVPEAVLKPIDMDGRTVGYLGYVPRLKMVTSLEQLFSAQQTNKFAAIAIGMLIAGLVIAAVLANWLSLRIRRLAQAAEALIQGKYEMRIAPQGTDELAQLADDFNQLAHTLEAAQRARQQWIADIAHELRTPLAVLRAEIEALQDGIRPLGQQSLGSLAQEVTRLTRLVDDLRMLSLSDLGALTYNKERTHLAEVIEEVLSAHALALGDRRLTVTTDLDSDVQVMGDEARLTQVFGNLIQNTLRYTDEAGKLSVTLRRAPAGTATATASIASTASPSTSTSASPSPSTATIIWDDSSPGVPDAELPRLTERLYRVDSSRSSEGGGSGLGLAIARAIVEAHHGIMTPSASPWGGLRWTIQFPADPQSP